MRLVFESLPVVYADPGNLDARAHMMSAAAMGAVAFQKGLGALHSLSHPVGAVYGTHHGTTNAVVMPYVLEWNRTAIEAKMVRLAAWLGLADRSFSGVLAWVLELRREIGIPHTLAEIGVREEHARPFAPQALNDPSTGGNPLPMTEHDFEQLYVACIAGKLRAG